MSIVRYACHRATPYAIASRWKAMEFMFCSCLPGACLSVANKMEKGSPPGAGSLAVLGLESCASPRVHASRVLRRFTCVCVLRGTFAYTYIKWRIKYLTICQRQPIRPLSISSIHHPASHRIATPPLPITSTSNKQNILGARLCLRALVAWTLGPRAFTYSYPPHCRTAARRVARHEDNSWPRQCRRRRNHNQEPAYLSIILRPTNGRFNRIVSIPAN